MVVDRCTPGLLALLFLAVLGRCQEPRWIEGTTAKVCQITGDFDAARRVPVASLTAKRFGFPGTDLGSSFEHKGKLWFLFGDTPGRPGDRDVLAWTEAKRAEDLVLEARVADDGKFEPLTVPGLTHAAYEIPTCGISYGGKMYVLFTSGHSKAKTMHRSVLAVSEDDGKTFKQVGELSSKHFINAAMALATPLPGVFYWGTGDYRKSSPRLCFASDVDSTRVRFYRGSDRDGPRWSIEEDDAVPLFDHPVCGELSVAWIKEISRWVMLYNSTEPRGIVMRTSPSPEGPWSAPTVIFDPWREGGYPQFMHVSWKHARLDAFQDPGRENEWGGEYGPFLIPRFTRGDASRATIFFTLSTWNPYQVVLMRADVGKPQGADTHAWNERKTLPGSGGWTATPGMFKLFERGGAPHVTTFAAKGDAGTGVAWHDFEMYQGASISFTLHGGRAEVVLVQSEKAPDALPSDVAAFYERLKAGTFGHVLEAVSAASSNEKDIAIRWNVDRAAGQPLRLYVIDHLAGPWGFVSVSEIMLEGVRR